MDEDLLKIKKLLLQYVRIIIKEYPNSSGKAIIDKINNEEELIEFNKSNSISFFVRNGRLLLPEAAYKVFPFLKQYENYGTKPNNSRNIEDYLDTNTTYQEYFNHVVEGALSVYDYFEESLLHEAMHLCGSNGGTPLEEGINELKTRELAQKYGIKIAAYGYSKEVEIAKRLQELIGKEIFDELTFVPITKRKTFLSDKVDNEATELYGIVSNKMIEVSREYYSRLSQIDNPIEKAQLYDSINYSEVHKIIDNHAKKNANRV